MSRPESWLKVTPSGLYCVTGDFYVDPVRAVERAVVTHGHADHARPGHAKVLASEVTLAIMRARYGAGRAEQALAYGETVEIGSVRVRLAPAGHILGSAQVVLEHAGSRVVISGDYKRRPDPTCAPFEPVACDVFVTEATFALPVFRHPAASGEIAKLLGSVALFPERAHLVGVYALGKAQRVIKLLRLAGYDRPIWLHGALAAITELYQGFGLEFGDLRPVRDAAARELAGEIVLAPPGALADRWSRRLPDPVPAMASGWMRIRARARQRGAELPLIISDHADWDELTQTVREVAAPRLWVTHGHDDALVHFARGIGIEAEALALVGYDEDEA